MRATAVTIALTTATVVVGSVGTDPESDWYEALDKPAWQPPAVAFPLVWTPLYVTIAYGTGRAIQRAARSRRRRLWALTIADLAARRLELGLLPRAKPGGRPGGDRSAQRAERRTRP